MAELRHSWRASTPGDTTDPAVLGACISALRREYNGTLGEETLTDAVMAPGTTVVQLPDVVAASIVPRWHRGANVRGGCEWVLPPGFVGSSSCNRRILFCHGGGYTSCDPALYRAMVSRFATVTGLPCFVFDYRKAPEHAFPAAVDDTMVAYRWVAAHGPGGEPTPAVEVVLMGDSAGGGWLLRVRCALTACCARPLI